MHEGGLDIAIYIRKQVFARGRGEAPGIFARFGIATSQRHPAGSHPGLQNARSVAAPSVAASEYIEMLVGKGGQADCTS